jgi:CelD/BcsL family acetyltransferase involved in cellulose biosynthesis
MLRVAQPELTGQLSFAVHSSLADAEPAWRDLEARGVLTPYQRFDWISQYCEAGFDGDSGSTAILVVSEDGAPVAILPLRITSWFGARIGRIIGSAISNSDSLIYDPIYRDRLTQDALNRAFAALSAHGHRVDLLSFQNLVGDAGTNPLLAFPHAPAPNNLYVGSLLTPDGVDIETSLSRKRRNNLKRGMRRLTELFGEVELRRASTPEEIDAFEEVFFEQRSRRFREMGVKNVFGTPEFRAFYRDVARVSLGKAQPALTVHALMAGGEILATSFGVYSPGHYSQQINSTADGPAAKYSLSGVLLMLLLEELRVQGFRTFDLGLGDFEYKTEWTEASVVYDSIVPVSGFGTDVAPLLRGARMIKRTIKQTPALWRVARSVQALLARFGDRTR